MLANLLLYYRCDEASGDLTDAGANGLHATAVNAPGTGAGKVGTARTFVTASSQCFDRTGLTQLNNLQSALWVSMWAKPTVPASGATLCHFRVLAGNLGFLTIFYNAGTQKFRATWRDAAAGTITIEDTHLPDAASGTDYYLINTWWDPAQNKAFLKINDYAADELACVGLRQLTSIDLRIGAQGTTTPNLPMTGSIDEFGAWLRIPTSVELAMLWNGGVGLAYPFYEGVNTNAYYAPAVAVR